jgi:phosphate acyltransferase
LPVQKTEFTLNASLLSMKQSESLGKRPVRISLDAMGGDHAPDNEIDGALAALREANNRFEVVFIGPEDLLEKHMQSRGAEGMRYSIVHASQVIGMHDSPVAALREKKDATISVGLNLHREQQVDAFVSTGNTGAVVSASIMTLGRLKDVSRPTIGAFLPTETGVTLLLDAGAVTDCKPHFLYEFAVMGSIYAQLLFHKEKPLIGILNIGEEPGKGDELSKAAYKMLEQSSLNFIGNIEGRDILKGKADVVVCDGFTGNVLLKFAESVIDILKNKFRSYADRGLLHKIWMGMMRGTLRSILKEFDYQEYGGVPLLGVKGITIIGHGGSTPKAIKNMILKADEMIRYDINERIENALHTMRTVPASVQS